MQYIRLSTGALKSHFHWDFNQEERCTWYEILLISRESLYPGYLQQSPGRGYPMTWIGGQLGISAAKTKRHINKFLKDGSIEMDKNGCIKIVNWEKYQPKYNKYAENESNTNHHKPKSYTESTYTSKKPSGGDYIIPPLPTREQAEAYYAPLEPRPKDKG